MATIFHVSDLHIGKYSKNIQAPDCDISMEQFHLHRVHALLNEVESAARRTVEAGDNSVVVVTGDLTDQGWDKQFACVEEELQRIKGVCPVRIVPGNHDYGNFRGCLFVKKSVRCFDELAHGLGMKVDFSAKYEGILESHSYAGAPYFETFGGADHSPVCLVYLNSCSSEGLEDFSRGDLGDLQLEMLESGLNAYLKENGNIPVFLCMHHKPLTRGYPDPVMGLDKKDRVRLGEIANGRVGAILYGHQSELKFLQDLSPIIWPAKGTQTPILIDGNGSVSTSLGYARISVSNGAIDPGWVAVSEPVFAEAVHA